MTPVGAVIFDFNGVLVDDEAIHFTLFQELLTQEGVDITEADYHERYLGYDDRGCFEAALTDAGQSVDRERLSRLIARKGQRYVEVAEKALRFFPRAAETLGAVMARWPVAICSGALRTEIEYGLRRLGRLDQITAIISAEDTVQCKPHPDGYQLALAALRAREVDDESMTPRHQGRANLDAVNCLVVEDSLAGIISAKRAGMRAIGVAHTYSAERLREAGADAVIPGLATLTPDWIEQRFAS
jgi:beta-phosphoglucomutase-like phosphatase (HAD superfamily)